MLNENKHEKADEKMRNLLNDFPTLPPSGIWERVFSIIHGKSYPFFNLGRMPLYIAGITALFFTGYFFLTVNQSEEKIAEVNNVNAENTVTTKTVAQNTPGDVEKENINFTLTNPVKETASENIITGKTENKDNVIVKAEPSINEKTIPADDRKSKPSVNSAMANENSNAAMTKGEENISSIKSEKTNSLQENKNEQIIGNNPGAINFSSEKPSFPIEKTNSPVPVNLSVSLNKVACFNAFPLRNETLMELESRKIINDLSIQLPKQAEDDKYISNRKTGDYNGLHLGITFLAHNSYIMNQNTYNEFSGSELNYQMTFGSTYGVSVGYDFSSPYGIQAEYLMNSVQGQHYKDKLNKINVDRKVDLVYSHLPVIFKFKRILGSSLLRTVVNRNILVGVQGSKLEQAVLSVNENKVDVTERFKKYDAGILLGWEYAFSLKGRLHFSLGLRGSFSVMDINEKAWRNDSKYPYSHNMLFSLQTKIYYVFKPFDKPRYSYMVY